MRIRETRVADAEMKQLNFRPIIYLYIYIPILLFVAGWYKWYISIPLVCGMLYVFFRFFMQDRKEGNAESAVGYALSVPDIISSVIVFLILLFWCIVSGQGGYVTQTGDWDKHNTVLNVLTSNPWPVRGNFDGKEGVLTYYVAGYLVPAACGKIYGGFITAQFITLFWTLAGLMLIMHLIADILNIKNPWLRIAIVPAFALFSSFSVLLSMAYSIVVPGDLYYNSTHFLSNSILVQFTSNILNLSWVYPQALAGWLLTLMLIKDVKRIERWGVIIAPAAIYSTFVFVVLLVFAAMLLLFKENENLVRGTEIKGLLKEAFGVSNIITIVLASTFVWYLMGSILQDKRGYMDMGYSLIDYRGHLRTFVFLSLMWGMWALLLIKKEYDNFIFYAASLMYFLLMVGKMGFFNDLCMRGSLVPVTVYSVLVIKNLLDERNDKWYRVLLAVFLILNALGGICEVIGLVKANGIDFEATEQGYSTLSEFVAMLGREKLMLMRYQYVNWEPDGFVRFLLR